MSTTITNNLNLASEINRRIKSTIKRYKKDSAIVAR